MNILDIAIAKQLAGGGGSGTDNYNELSNLPKINDTTLSGNKTSANLGLQSEINSDSKLASDLVDDTNQDNKFVSSTEKNTWNAKQNAIDSDHKLSSDLVDDANKTNKFVTTTEKNTWNSKQNAIDAEHKLSSSLVSFTEAEAAALASGIDSSKVGQISTNQTNILYALETGAANYAPLDSSSRSGSGYFLDATQSGMKVFTSGTVMHVYCEYTKPTSTQFSIQFTDESGDIIAPTSVYAPSAPTSGTISADVTLPQDVYGYNAYYNGASGTTCTITNVMICPKNVWDAIQKYEPYALPNYDLTYLQAEDRAALAEEIDAGAKNMLNFDLTSLKALNTSGTWNGNSYIKNGVTFTYNDSTKTISTYGTSNTVNTIFYLMNFTPTSGKSFTISGCPSGGSTPGYRFCNVGTTWADDYGSSSTAVGDGTSKEMAIYISNSGTAVGTSSNPLTWKPMICTKAAFGVSQKFVPYRLPYDTLGRLQWKTYEISLASVSFVKSGGGLYYYYFSVANDFSEVLSVTIAGFSATSNKGFSAYMEAGKIGLIVYDATDPQSLVFSSGQIWLKVVGFK